MSEHYIDYDTNLYYNSESIREELKSLEYIHDIQFLYVAESGSRAWGFPSKKSDFDVRGIYIHKPAWYLSLAPKKDVVNTSFKSLDITGWDLRKALKLFRKNNPPLLEWLSSPYPYLDKFDVASQLRQWKHPYFSGRTGIHCYTGLAKSEFVDIMKMGERVSMKKYLYVLRSLFACRYIHSVGSWPPMEMRKLMQVAMPDDKAIQDSVEDLISRKIKSDDEIVYTDRLHHIDDFIDVEIQRFEHIGDTYDKDEKPIDWKLLDELFRTTLYRVNPITLSHGGESWQMDRRSTE